MPLNLVMEWASPAGARSVELFDFQEKDFPNLQFEQLLFPARQLPVDIECSEFRTKITPAGKEAYLPLDALLVALYEKGEVQRRILDVLRELDSKASIALSVANVYEEGMLIPAAEEAGFRLQASFQIEEERQTLCQIGWMCRPKAKLLFSAMLEFCPDAAGALGEGRWGKPQVTGLNQLLVRELQRMAPKPIQLLTEKGIHYAQTQTESFICTIETPEGRVDLSLNDFLT